MAVTKSACSHLAHPHGPWQWQMKQVWLTDWLMNDCRKVICTFVLFQNARHWVLCISTQCCCCPKLLVCLGAACGMQSAVCRLPVSLAKEKQKQGDVCQFLVIVAPNTCTSLPHAMWHFLNVIFSIHPGLNKSFNHMQMQCLGSAISGKQTNCFLQFQVEPCTKSINQLWWDAFEDQFSTMCQCGFRFLKASKRKLTCY